MFGSIVGVSRRVKLKTPCFIFARRLLPLGPPTVSEEIMAKKIDWMYDRKACIYLQKGSRFSGSRLMYGSAG